MSVIPFRTKDKYPRAYNVTEDFEEFKHNDSLICILSMRPETDENACNASYDLHVGYDYRYQNGRQRKKDVIADDEEIIIEPRSGIIFQTLETVYLSKLYMGFVSPKVSLLQQGVSNTFSKVDPGYNGKLLISLFNLGDQTVTIKQGDPFCTLILLEIDDRNIKPYNKGEARFKNEHNIKLSVRLRNWSSENPALIAIFGAIIGGVVTGLFTILAALPSLISLLNKLD